MTAKFWVGLGIFVLIALSGVIYQKCKENLHCEYDGASIIGIYEVEIVLKDRSSRKFCSIYCAKQWFDKNRAVTDQVFVTDEVRGNMIESSMTYYVTSDLITNEANGNRIHAFQQRQAALAHAEKFNGSPADDPFDASE